MPVNEGALSTINIGVIREIHIQIMDVQRGQNTSQWKPINTNDDVYIEIIREYSGRRLLFV